jgi:hypothetical protein
MMVIVGRGSKRYAVARLGVAADLRRKTAMPASLMHALAVAAISTIEPGRFRGVKLGT